MSLEALLARLSELAIAYGPRLVAALALVAAFWAGSRLLQRLLLRLGRRLGPSREPIIEFLAQAARLAVLAWGVVTALGTLGVNVSALVAGLGLTGFALGFAFKDALSNLLAGILVLLYRPFRIGDRVSISGNEGDVVHIDLRYTELRGEARTFLVPNSLLLSNTIAIERKPAAQRPPVAQASLLSLAGPGSS